MKQSFSFLCVILLSLAACSSAVSQTVAPALPGGPQSSPTTEPGPRTNGDTKTAPSSNPWQGAELIPTPAVKGAEAIRAPAISNFTLRNGLEVMVIADSRLPIVEMQAAVRVGQQDVLEGKQGIAQFAALVYAKETVEHSSQAIHGALSFIGGALSSNATYENTFFSCSTVKRHERVCMDFLPSILQTPRISQRTVEAVRDQMLSYVERRNRSAGDLANSHIQNLLWGVDHVRGWPITGKTLNSITRADLKKWHKTYFIPKNTVLVVMGDVQPAALKKRLNKAFRKWRNRRLPKVKKYVTPSLPKNRVLLIDMPGQKETHIRMAMHGVAQSDPRFYAVEVMNYLLGGDKDSRLARVVKKKTGDDYHAQSFFDRNRSAGTFLISAVIPNQQAVSVTDAILDDLSSYTQQGMSAKKIDDAIMKLSGNFALSLDSYARMARAFLLAKVSGLGSEFLLHRNIEIAKVKGEEIRQVAMDIVNTDKVVVVMVGDGEVLEREFKKAGWSYERFIYTEPVSATDREALHKELDIDFDRKARARGRKIIDKAIQAKGGLARLEGIKTLVMRAVAQITIQGTSYPAELQRYFELPLSLRLEMSIANGQVRTITAGSPKGGWIQQARGKNISLKKLNAVELEQVQIQIWRDQEFILLRALEKGAIVGALSGRGKKPTFAIRIVRPDLTAAVTLYIDKRNYLIRRMTYIEQGRKVIESYSQYRKHSGLQIAEQRDIAGAFTFRLKVKEVLVNEPIAAKVFEFPGK